MMIKKALSISRRHFLASASLAAVGAWLIPRRLFAQEGGIVNFARSEAAKADITVQRLRGNISVLIGSGGNIAVLQGRDGKLSSLCSDCSRRNDSTAGLRSFWRAQC